jgi:hypothetical protein
LRTGRKDGSRQNWIEQEVRMATGRSLGKTARIVAGKPVL